MSNFILKTLLKSYRRSWETMLLSDEYYFTHYSDVFQRLMKNSQINIVKDDGGMIKAFILSDNEKKIVHFVYVRNSHRKTALGYQLIAPFIENNSVKVSFITKDFKETFKKLNIIYEPFSRYYV